MQRCLMGPVVQCPPPELYALGVPLMWVAWALLPEWGWLLGLILVSKPAPDLAGYQTLPQEWMLAHW